MVAIDIARLSTALGATSAQEVDPYNIPETTEALDRATAEEGVSVIVVRAPCYLMGRRTGDIGFVPRSVQLDPEKCNGCRVCIDFFGCPAIRFADGKASIDQPSCVGCGMCVDVCKRGAISWT